MKKITINILDALNNSKKAFEEGRLQVQNTANEDSDYTECRYRSGELGKVVCVVGTCISDTDYDERMEGAGVFNMIPTDSRFMPQVGIEIESDNPDALIRLQNIHDSALQQTLGYIENEPVLDKITDDPEQDFKRNFNKMLEEFGLEPLP